ncbi:MAG: DEAD/DEAH box helicase [Candidatus Cybelea sp.]
MTDFFDHYFANTGLPERAEQTAWQRTEHAQHGTDPKRAEFASPRLGKSLVALAAALESGRDRILITAPLVACPQWARLVRDCGITPIELYGCSTKIGAEVLNTLHDAAEQIVVINDDKLAWLYSQIDAWGPQYIIGDESHRFAGVSTKRGRIYRRLAWSADGVRILTGTPVPNHYGSLWGQMAGLDRNEWFGSYEAFAQRYLIRDAMFPSIVLGYQHETELYDKIRRFAAIVRREDVFGPDTWQEVLRPVTLPAKAASVYRKLAKEWFIDEPITLDVTHTLARMTRLHQLTSGFLPDLESEDRSVLELHRAKRDAILADLEQIVADGEKAVIFHRFTAEGNALHDDISTAFKVPVLKIDGSTASAARDDVYEVMEKHQGACVAVIQTQSGGIARSLAEAQHVMFASRGFSFVEEEQARDRVYKPGERRIVYDYVAEGTIDEYIADILRSKEAMHQAVRNADRESVAFGPRIKRPSKRNLTTVKLAEVL